MQKFKNDNTMKKLILSLFCVGMFISTQAQLQQDNRTISFGTGSKQSNVINKGLTTCNNDTLDYTLAKATGLQSLNINNATSAQALSQYYNAPQAITVHGATFYAYKLDATGGTTLNVTVELYLAGTDSMPTGTALASGTITIDTTFGGGSLAALEKSISFASPVTVNQPYVIVVGNYSANGMGMVCNSWTAADGGQEWLAGVDLFGTWTRSYNVNIGGVLFDADPLVLPHVSYDLTSDFSANPLYFNTAPTNVTFTDNSSPILQDRMYNQAAFIASTQLSYTYDFGDGSPEVNAINTNNNYNLVQPYTVTLKDTLFGWRVNCSSSDTLMLNTPTDLVITEIMYNPPESGTDTSEFIEIYNNGANAVNLLNFTCTGGIYTFPNVSLAAGAYYVITIDSSGFFNTYGFSADGVFTSGLSNAGESIVIKNPAGTIIDSVFYDDVAPWPSGSSAGQPDGGGASLILCDVNTDNNIGSNWSACTTSANITINGFPVLASPGVANVCAPSCNNPDVPTVSTNPTTVCDGSTTTLTITGNLNDASKWYIYTSSCGGTIVDSTANSSYVVTPTGPSSTYFIRGEGNCVTPGSCGNVTVNVLPALTGSVTNTICNNGSVVVNGTTYNAGNPSGTEVFTNVGPNNCDSTVTINLTVLSALTGTINQTICFGDSIVVNGTTYNTTVSGATEVFTNVGPNGCDSTVTINLTVSPAIDNTTTVSGNTITANETGASYQWLDCDNGNAVINGETSQSFTATVTGNYAVEITVGNCVDTSACENVNVVGIDELSKASVNVYPNPTNGIITVDFSSTVSSVHYTLMSIDGKTVAQGKFSGTKLMLNLENESKGIYFLKVENATINYVQKVFKN
jgi:hypothetical protein